MDGGVEDGGLEEVAKGAADGPLGRGKNAEHGTRGGLEEGVDFEDELLGEGGEVAAAEDVKDGDAV
jgi:hypothetical protein